MTGSGYFAKIDTDKCTGCGLCAKKCNFLAIEMGEDKKAKVNVDLCKGCEACMTLCKFDAISMEAGDFSVNAPFDIKALKAAKAK